jgi:hypothetical protein
MLLNHNEGELIFLAAKYCGKDVFTMLQDTKSTLECHIALKFSRSCIENTMDKDGEHDLASLICSHEGLGSIQEIWDQTNGLKTLQRIFLDDSNDDFGIIARTLYNVLLSRESEKQVEKIIEIIEILEFVFEKSKEFNLLDEYLDHYIKNYYKFPGRIEECPKKVQKAFFKELSEAQIKKLYDFYDQIKIELNICAEYLVQPWEKAVKNILLLNAIKLSDQILFNFPPGLIPLITEYCQEPAKNLEDQQLAAVFFPNVVSEEISISVGRTVNAILMLTTQEQNDILSGNLRGEYLQEAIKDELGISQKENNNEGKGESKRSDSKSSSAPASSSSSSVHLGRDASSSSDVATSATMHSAGPSVNPTAVSSLVTLSSSSSSASYLVTPQAAGASASNIVAALVATPLAAASAASNIPPPCLAAPVQVAPAPASFSHVESLARKRGRDISTLPAEDDKGEKHKVNKIAKPASPSHTAAVQAISSDTNLTRQ